MELFLSPHLEAVVAVVNEEILTENQGPLLTATADR